MTEDANVYARLIERLQKGVESRMERNECNDGSYRIDDIEGANKTMLEAAEALASISKGMKE